MTPDPRQPLEPTPRFEGGPPAFVPPPREIARGPFASSAERRPQPPAARPGAPQPRTALAALLAALLALAVYASGTARTVMTGDSAELAAVGVAGGVAHPTGYPTFVLLANLAAQVLPGDPAHRIALFCALAGAASVGVFGLLLAELGLTFTGVLAGALLYAGTFTLWWSAIRVEVYTPALLLALFALWRVFVARRTLRARDGLLAAFAMGLALTGHLSFAPALALAGLWMLASAARAGALSAPLVLGALVMLVLGVSPYASIAFADRAHTLTNYLHLVVEPAAGQFGLTPATFDSAPERLRFLIFGAESRPHDFVHHLPTAASNLFIAWARIALFDVGPLALLLAIVGTFSLQKRDDGAQTYLVSAALVTSVLGALVVHEALLVVFLMMGVISVCALAASGLDVLARRITPVAAAVVTLGAIMLPHALRQQAARAPIGAPYMTMPVEGPPALRTLFPTLRFAAADAPDSTRARAVALLNALPESSFVAAKWELVTTLVYLQAVERMRTDVTLDAWYEPSHALRIERWQQAHSLATHPVVVVDSIAGLTERLAAPTRQRLPDGRTLLIERTRVRTERD